MFYPEGVYVLPKGSRKKGRLHCIHSDDSPLLIPSPVYDYVSQKSKNRPRNLLFNCYDPTIKLFNKQRFELSPQDFLELHFPMLNLSPRDFRASPLKSNIPRELKTATPVLFKYPRNRNIFHDAFTDSFTNLYSVFVPPRPEPFSSPSSVLYHLNEKKDPGFEEILLDSPPKSGHQIVKEY